MRWTLVTTPQRSAEAQYTLEARISSSTKTRTGSNNQQSLDSALSSKLFSPQGCPEKRKGGKKKRKKGGSCFFSEARFGGGASSVRTPCVSLAGRTYHSHRLRSRGDDADVSALGTDSGTDKRTSAVCASGFISTGRGWGEGTLARLSHSVPPLLSSILSSQDCENRKEEEEYCCLLYTSPSPRDATLSRMPSSA